MEFWKDYHGYKVSNYGNIVNRHGKPIKTHISTDKHGGRPFKEVILRIDGKRIERRVASLVYRLFGEGWKEGRLVYLIDGNPDNCRIENLKISRAYTETATDEQIATYKNGFYPCIKSIIKVKGYLCYQGQGLDIDNVIGETARLCWLHLPQYTKSFYCFVKKYARFAFLRERKKWKEQWQL